MSSDEPDDATLARAIAAGDRRALARGITLVESDLASHQARAEALLETLLPHTGQARRLGISGPPGVGKSTFVEAFGLYAAGMGQRIAVLAIDPSSRISGGSILGDKTRMEELSRHPSAFVRPSPAGRTLGGVARRTREAGLLCEAAGFDLIVIETVGVGQSEATVADMVDVFLLLLAPGGGDELQGIKRGIVELVDLIAINKSDGDLRDAAGRIAADYHAALGLLRSPSRGWRPEVTQCSALERRGIDGVWDAFGRCATALKESGAWEERRRRQLRDWMWQEVTDGILQALDRDESSRAVALELEAEVVANRLLPPTAARQVRASFLGAIPAK